MTAVATDIATQQVALLEERRWRAEAHGVLAELDALVKQAPERLEDLGAAVLVTHIRQLADELAERVR